MDLYLLDQSFVRRAVIEGWESAIWTERYDEHSDLVMKFSLKHKQPKDFPERWYVSNPESNELMIIHSAKVEYDPEDGRHLTVTAHGLTWLLTQRIIWNQTNLDGSLSASINRLLNENIVGSTLGARRVSNLAISSPSNVPAVYTLEAQYHGENLYKAISDLCKSFDIGFKITHPTTGQFRFQLYGGINRSYEQTLLPYVVFSPEFDNLANGEYFRSIEGYCNAVLVAGEGEGDKKVFMSVTKSNAGTGVNRYEHYLNAERRSSNEKAIPAAVYQNYLAQQGRNYISDNPRQNVYDGETDPLNSFKLGTDYFLGDIVQLHDEDTVISPARIVEYIRSDDKSDGYQEFPGVRVIEDEV